MDGSRIFAMLFAVAPAIGWAAPGHAQCRLCERPQTELAGESTNGTIALQIESGIDFDNIVLLGPGQGSATLLPDGTVRVSGTIAAIGGRPMVGNARVRGEPGRMVRITMPRDIELRSLSGGLLRLTDIVSDLPAAPRLDSRGILEFRFGGRLEVDGGLEGEFRGNLAINVDYL